MNSIKFVIIKNRTNITLIDLILRRRRTAIANHVSTSKFLVKHESHLALHKLNNVEIGDVKNIIAIKLLLLIHSGRGSLALSNREELLDLLITLNITLSPRIVRGDISNRRTDISKRRMSCRAKDISYPTHLTRNELRRRSNGLSIREQNINICNSIGGGMPNNRLLKRTKDRNIIHRIRKQAVHIGVAKNSTAIGVVAVKNIMRKIVVHIIILIHIGMLYVLVGVIPLLSLLNRNAYKIVTYGLLVVIHRIVNFTNSLPIRRIRCWSRGLLSISITHCNISLIV